jgi:glutamate dehydrogenase
MLEEGVTGIVRSWADGLAEALLARHDAGRAAALIARYRDAFSAAYTDDFAPEDAIADIDAFERLSVNRPIAGEFLPGEAGHPPVTLKLIHLGAPIALSKRVPMLENMGFRVIDERSYEITPADGHAPIILHDMALERADGKAIGLDRLAPLLVAAFMAVWFGHAESDGYNALVLEAGLAWRDIALIRSVSRYLRQAGQPYSQSYMWETLNRHPAIARIIVELFHARFAPGGKEASAKSWMAKIEAGLEAVKSLDEDRIIRAFVNAVSAMVRTNFFQLARDGTPHDEISFKLDSTMIDGLPAPKPFREVFVYSPRVEGIHLRFGRIARGGIRWSDRPQDFRTEILGLVKAQQVKNAVIVPVGAKGGFIPKHLPVGGSRDAVLAEGTAAYRIFIATLLDITDNLDGDTVVPPDGVERREGDDPYFVVAADKGTATFSDTANAIALARGFWLGDAFASGGSAGYDHKAMGITARGAWEAVKRHFREIDRDIQATPFTAVGVGDMSGDVFGNAMLLSPATKLVAAFDHRDIFVDPDPDPAAGLEERKQLFGLPRSSWQDYDRRKISAGGGVFARAEKFIKLSREMKALLDLPGATATPQEIILRILKAKVDLLFFGGIGTFVRGPAESDDRVGDRANDAARVTALDIRARVIGEGANLGMTQQARIAFNLAGGRCNSDAIDNSAGVNTSDVEVNIKIALGQAVRAGRLDLKRRNRLLAAMTGEVAALVLRNNYLQTLAISLAERRGFEDFAFQQRMMQGLESRGLLDRKVETLPDDAAMAERQAAGKPLTRAEIGVLLAYAKIALSADLLEGDVAGDPFLAGELVRYFPKRMQKDYRAEIEGHRLRREIIATMTSNAMINRGGPTYLTRVADRTGAGPIDIARAFVAVRDAFGLRDLNGAIDGLDGKIPGAVQLGLYRAVEDLLVAKTVWFLRHASFAAGIGPVIAAYGKSVAALGALLDKALPAHLGTHIAAEAARLAAAGVPGPLARRIARLPGLADAADIHLVAEAAGCPLARAAEIFFAIAEEFRIGRIEARAGGLPLADYFDGLALDRALETLADAHRRLAIDVLGRGGDGEPLTAWRGAREAALERTMRTVTAMVESEELTVSRVTVAANLLSDLARGQDRPAKGGAF